MDIVRQIGDQTILVDAADRCGLYFEAGSSLASGGPHERGEILRALASGDAYLPLSLQWELLDRCNFACPFCYIVGHSFQKLVRFSEIQHHVSDLIDEGLLFCTLTGGEVTIHPDFCEIYSFLKSAGVIVDVFTNGYAISDELISLFRLLPPSSVEVSIYSLDDSRLRDIYGARSHDAASTVLANILKMRDSGIHVVAKTFLNTATALDFDEVTSWCAENGIEHYSSTQMTKAYDGSNLSEFETNELTQISGRRGVASVSLPCGTKNYGSAIDASFSIFPCPAIRLAECTFDIREFGVPESLARMKTFMRRFQDEPIRDGFRHSKGSATCMAYAAPVRDQSGKLLHFAQQ